MSNLDSFGLEDLHVGIHRSVNRSASLKGLRSLMAGPILDSSNTDSSYFAMEAMTLLGDSDKFGIYAAQGLEQLDHDVRILQRVKSVYGIEKLNPYTFGMEGNFGASIKTVMKKIWAAIVEAFKRIVQAISNFLRTIANFFGSAIAKTQSKLYAQYKDKVGDIERSDKTIKAATPRGDVSKLIGSISNAIGKGIGLLYKHTTHVENAVNQLSSTGDYNLITRGCDSLAEVETQATAAILGFAAKHGRSGGKGLSNPRKDVLNLFWENDGKPSEIKIGQYIKIVDFSILSESVLVGMQQLVKVTQQSLKAAHKALKIAEKAAIASQKMDNRFQKADLKDDDVSRKTLSSANKGFRALEKSVKQTARASSWERMYCGYATGLILNTYSQFLKARTYAANGVRVAMSKRSEKEK